MAELHKHNHNKKQKTVTNHDETLYFAKFLKDKKNEELLDNMRVSLDEIGIGCSNMIVSFLRVEEANATCSVSFKYATCDVTRIKCENGKNVLAPIGVFFQDGMAVLKNFLDNCNPSIPENVAERRALQDLLQFLSCNDHSVLRGKRCREGEEIGWMVALQFVQHLMLPLVPLKTFFIDSFTGIKLRKCLSIEQPVDGKFSDTSFGCSPGWYGKADFLIMDKEIPLSVAEAPDNSDLTSIYSDSDSVVEAKKGEHFPSCAVNQMLAQTITFSFLQHKQNNDTARHSLVPGIGICSEQLLIHLYDCVEDVLLEIFPLDLFLNEGKELNTRTILVLWMVLNYKLFCSGLTDVAKKYKSSFHEKIGPEYLKIYRNEVDKPMRVSSDNRMEYNLYGPSGEYASLLFKNYVLPKKKTIQVI